jgi:H+/Cl- antiporter ClcA
MDISSSDVKIRGRRPQRLFVEAFLGTRRKLFTFVVIVGLVSGCIGAVYLAAMHALQRVLWPTHWSTFPHLWVMVAAGLAVGVITRVLGNPGDVELLVNNIHVLGGAEDIKDLKSLIPVSLICIAAGGAMGPEAPLVQTTGSVGSWMARRWGLERDELRILTITGMAAGFTVLFGAPLGSAIFALEILHRRGLEYYEALLPAILGSLSGYLVYATLTGAGLRPIWHFPHAAPLRAVDLAWAIGCGAAGALVAVVFTYLTNFLRAALRTIPPGVRPVLGGLGLGLLAFWSPYALTFGEAQIDPLIARRAVVSVLVVAVLAKLLGTSLTLSSGWRGGFIIPLFFMGVTLGRLGHLTFHGTNEVVLMTALMAACNVGVTKTPLGSTLVVSEMAGLALAPTTLLAAVVSLFLTSEVGLIHTQRRREGELGDERGDDHEGDDGDDGGGLGTAD